MPEFDSDYWERLWADTLRRHPDKVAMRPPNADLVAQASSQPPGRALDAGCGHGAETLWLAAHDWQVDAVDFSAAALAHARSMAEAADAGLACRIDWIEADLGCWTPEAGRYDLVSCLYVHVAGSVAQMIARMAHAVAPGGVLLMLGHRALEPDAAGGAKQVQITVADVLAVLDAGTWEFLAAEERPRSLHGPGIDSMIRARRRG
jgi:2-polyprenyl-3-methyl-5-hydroxy-6-metoxy-1,4-benzoquinol methylase